jgi:hypothetical protein
MYSPNIFKILAESCYSTDFYSRVKDISMKRSIGFLLLFSLCVSIVSFVLMSLYFSKHQDRSDEILQAYDTYLPPFEVIYSDGQLETIPSQFSSYFTINENQEIELQEEKMSSSIFVLQVDTEKTSETLLTQQPLPLSGVYVMRDALVVYTGIQNTVLDYSNLEIPQGVAFSKETIRPQLEQHLPTFLDWARKIAVQFGTALMFFYTFISSWVLALFSSLFGILILLIRQKPVQFPFLIKLSFFSSVPAFLILLLTYLLSISVPFLPFIIYVCFYYYGLRVYER